MIIPYLLQSYTIPCYCCYYYDLNHSLIIYQHVSSCNESCMHKHFSFDFVCHKNCKSWWISLLDLGSNSIPINGLGQGLQDQSKKSRPSDQQVPRARDQFLGGGRLSPTSNWHCSCNHSTSAIYQSPLYLRKFISIILTTIFFGYSFPSQISKIQLYNLEK
jgi:hypothetical protein